MPQLFEGQIAQAIGKETDISPFTLKASLGGEREKVLALIDAAERERRRRAGRTMELAKRVLESQGAGGGGGGRKRGTGENSSFGAARSGRAEGSRRGGASFTGLNRADSLRVDAEGSFRGAPSRAGRVATGAAKVASVGAAARLLLDALRVAAAEDAANAAAAAPSSGAGGGGASKPSFKRAVGKVLAEERARSFIAKYSAAAPPDASARGAVEGGGGGGAGGGASGRRRSSAASTAAEPPSRRRGSVPALSSESSKQAEQGGGLLRASDTGPGRPPMLKKQLSMRASATGGGAPEPAAGGPDDASAPPKRPPPIKRSASAIPSSNSARLWSKALLATSPAAAKGESSARTSDTSASALASPGPAAVLRKDLITAGDIAGPEAPTPRTLPASVQNSLHSGVVAEGPEVDPGALISIIEVTKQDVEQARLHAHPQAPPSADGTAVASVTSQIPHVIVKKQRSAKGAGAFAGAAAGAGPSTPQQRKAAALSTQVESLAEGGASSAGETPAAGGWRRSQTAAAQDGSKRGNGLKTKKQCAAASTRPSAACVSCRVVSQTHACGAGDEIFSPRLSRSSLSLSRAPEEADPGEGSIKRSKSAVNRVKVSALSMIGEHGGLMDDDDDDFRGGGGLDQAMIKRVRSTPHAAAGRNRAAAAAAAWADGDDEPEITQDMFTGTALVFAWMQVAGMGSIPEVLRRISPLIRAVAWRFSNACEQCICDVRWFDSIAPLLCVRGSWRGGRSSRRCSLRSTRCCRTTSTTWL